MVNPERVLVATVAENREPFKHEALYLFKTLQRFGGHLARRFAQHRAMSSKPSDEWVVPLCATHHRSLHQIGDEEGWWKQLNLDPLNEAQRLWQVTRIERGDNWPSTAQQPERPRASCACSDPGAIHRLATSSRSSAAY